MNLFRLICVELFLSIFLPALGQVPEGLLDFIPGACMTSLETDLLPCAIENLCFNLLPSNEEIDAIPSATEVQECIDIERAFCPITSRCPACKGKADDVFKCVITNSEEIPQNITDLINGCSLECNLVEDDTSMPTSPPNNNTDTDPPVPTPTDVPGSNNDETLSEAPVDVPSETPETNDTSIPVDSGVRSDTISYVEIITSMFYSAAFVLVLWK